MLIHVYNRALAREITVIDGYVFIVKRCLYFILNVYVHNKLIRTVLYVIDGLLYNIPKLTCLVLYIHTVLARVSHPHVFGQNFA